MKKISSLRSVTNILSSQSRKKLLIIASVVIALVLVGVSVLILWIINRRPPIQKDFAEIIVNEEVNPDGLSEEELYLSYMVRAETLARNGRNEEAKEALEKVATDSIEDYQLLVRISQIFSQINEPDRAKELLVESSNKVMAIDDVTVQIQAYEFYTNLQLPEYAEKHKQRAMQLNPQAYEDYKKLEQEEFSDGPT